MGVARALVGFSKMMGNDRGSRFWSFFGVLWVLILCKVLMKGGLSVFLWAIICLSFSEVFHHSVGRSGFSPLRTRLMKSRRVSRGSGGSSGFSECPTSREISRQAAMISEGLESGFSTTLPSSVTSRSRDHV